MLILLLGVAGILGMTWLFPLTGIVLHRAAEEKKTDSYFRPIDTELLRIGIIIPARNEENNLRHTLKSIRASIDALPWMGRKVSFEIWLGADGCNDRSIDVAQQYGCYVTEWEKAQGKWTVLQQLTREVQADWIVFADAGVVWPLEMMTRFVDSILEYPEAIGVAPAYYNARGGLIEKILWRIERHFKALESRSGGPVSVHGATVMYRREELLKVLQHLGPKRWLNDDVVLPLWLRSFFPEKRIRYLKEISVYDESHRAEKSPVIVRELGRRRRIVLGNIQWMREPMWRNNSRIRMLALRRIFRVFWAYWALCFLLGALLVIGELPVAAGIFAAGALLLLASVHFVNRVRVLVDAALASLSAPFYLLRGTEEAAWQ